jgi:hypothetical protein
MAVAHGSLRFVTIPMTMLWSAGAASGIDAHWIGPASGGSWDTPSNWSIGAVPDGPQFDVFIGVSTPASVTQSSARAVGKLILGANSTLNSWRLSLNSDSQIDGNVMLSLSGELRLAAGASLDGLGQITFASFADRTTRIWCDGGPLVIGSGLTIGNPTDPAGPTIGHASQPTINHGRIIGGGFDHSASAAMLVTGSSLHNLGSVEVGFARNIAFGGSYKRSDLGKLVSDRGRFVLRGIVQNDGTILNIDASTGTCLLDGTIMGGQINVSDGYRFSILYPCAGTFVGTSFTGRISLGNAVRLWFDDGVVRGSGSIEVAGAPIEGPSMLLSNSGSLTIESGVTIHGGGLAWSTGQGSGPGERNEPTHNFGTIRSDGGGILSVLGAPIRNAGRFEVARDSLLTTFGSSFGPASAVHFDSGGALAIEVNNALIGGQLIVNGILDLTGSDDSLELTFAPDLHFLTYYRIAVATDGVIGRFDDVTPGFDIRYDPDSILVAAVPEPSGSAFMGAALLCCTRRRRQARARARA